MAENVAPMPLDIPELKWQEFDPARFIMDYDKSADVLYIRPKQPHPGTSIDLDEEVWIRIDIATGEVLGFEIEGFESVFLAKHPEIAVVWKQAHAHKKPAIEGKLSLLDVLLNYLRSIIGSNHPQQPRLLPNA